MGHMLRCKPLALQLSQVAAHSIHSTSLLPTRIRPKHHPLWLTTTQPKFAAFSKGVYLMLIGQRNAVGTSMRQLRSRLLCDRSRGGSMAPAAAALLLLPCCLANSWPSISRRRIRTLSAVLGVLSVLYHRLSACRQQGCCCMATVQSWYCWRMCQGQLPN